MNTQKDFEELLRLLEKHNTAYMVMVLSLRMHIRIMAEADMEM